MTGRFSIETEGPLFTDLDGTHVVFHGINKSGSLAMAAVITEAMRHAGRGDDVFSHYEMSPLPLEVYRDLLAAQSGRFFAVGHYLYGALPPAPRRIWITQFRHPLPRAVSAYQWIKNKHAKHHGTTEGFPELSDFIRKTRGITHSQVIQFGAAYGRFRDSEARRLLPPKVLYELSVEAVERDVSCLGIAEHFEESIFCFAALCGLQSVAPWQRDDRNKGRTPVDELTDAERDLIREVYQWDFALYDWALRRFAEQNARIAFGPTLQAYKLACEGQYNRDRLLSDPASLLPARSVDGAPSAERDVVPDHRQDRLASFWTEAAPIAEAPRPTMALEKALAGQDAKIMSLNEHIASQAVTIQAQVAKISKLHQDVARQIEEIARVRTTLKKHNAAQAVMIEAQATKISELNRDVARQLGEIARIRTSRTEKFERLTQRLEQTRKSHEAKVTHLQAKLTNVVGSRSWQLTAPLRRIAALKRHLRG